MGEGDVYDENEEATMYMILGGIRLTQDNEYIEESWTILACT